MASVNRQRSAPTQQDFHGAISRGADSWHSACLRITRDDALAQDAVQDALVNAWSKRHQFQGTSRLETWIHRIAINSALAMIRKRRPESWTELDDLPGDEPSALEARTEQELARDLASALTGLSEMERVCFVLKHLEQWRLTEIAQELDTAVGPVKQALFRALGKLRTSLATRRRQA